MKNTIKMLMVAALAAVVFSGCTTDPYYDTAKGVYKGAKTAYKELDLKNEKIEKAAGYAEKYDGVRTSVRMELEGNDQTVDTSKTTEP